MNGAHGCSISGSGPSIFAFSKSRKKALKIGNAMREAVNQNGLKASTFISKINPFGPRILNN